MTPSVHAGIVRGRIQSNSCRTFVVRMHLETVGRFQTPCRPSCKMRKRQICQFTGKYPYSGHFPILGNDFGILSRHSAILGNGFPIFQNRSKILGNGSEGLRNGSTSLGNGFKILRNHSMILGNDSKGLRSDGLILGNDGSIFRNGAKGGFYPNLMSSIKKNEEIT
jgi:hypothetical protein